MTIYLVITGLVVMFGFVVLVGAPYLPTLSRQQKSALDLLGLRPGEHLLELGCGDGKIMVAAAKRGIRVTGYEINPLLAFVAWLRTRRYASQVSVRLGNYWRSNWPTTDGIYVFLLDKYMVKLDKKIAQQYKDKTVKLVSFAFKIPGKSITKSKDGLYLYRYEANSK